jgi:hypothetical protein
MLLLFDYSQIVVMYFSSSLGTYHQIDQQGNGEYQLTENQILTTGSSCGPGTGSSTPM